MGDENAEQLLKAAIRLNSWLLAGVFGSVCGLSLMGMTLVSLHRGLPQPGRYLNLLGVFLPGYEVSTSGAWIGLLWGAVIGALCAVFIYRVYARQLLLQIGRFADVNGSDSRQINATLLIDGRAFGVALGSLMALGLIVSTNWLVLRGTAAESEHARLLMHYLPGYSVDLSGSLIGAFELFALVFLASWLLSRIYNGLASRRGRNVA